MPDESPRAGLSILMPAFNLADTIGTNISRTVAATSALEDIEIIVIDDGSADDTRSKAEGAATNFNTVRVVGHTPNQGKGAALQAGFAVSSGSIVLFLDGDLDLPPEQIPAFLEVFRVSDVDGLVGKKQGAMEPGSYPLLRRLLSRTFSGVINLLFRLPVRETQTGLKVFYREPLVEVLPHLRVKRYSYDLELLVRLHRRGYTLQEAPVELAMGASASGVSVGTLWEMGRDTLRIWLRTIIGRN